MDYLERGFDKTMIAQGHQALAEASMASIGKTLMENSDCNSCHQLDQKSVGPTFNQISEKYGNDPNAIKTLAAKVIKGGGGVWGEVYMAAHPALSQSEAEQMVKYILSVSGKGQMGPKLPLKGSFTTNQHIGKGDEGSYIFTASYTDKGGEKIGPLTTSQTITLRSPVVPAYAFDETDKAMTFDVSPDMIPGLDEAIRIVIGNKGSYLRFNQLDLTGISTIDVYGVASSMFASGGLIEFRVGGVDGELIGSVDMESSLTLSMSADDLEPVQVPLTTTNGMHDVYVVFKGVEDGNKPVCALFSLEFKTNKGI
ncbi:MAG: carbohydrate-binding protein [Bacteroidetes bacterium]|nr:carbohydrate-binding protein [Bacteroidota bacterium]